MAVLTTMHEKERVIEPILRDELGLIIELAKGVNTDQFGTFSREIGRSGSQLEAARAKIAAGFACVPTARFGFASEGSFGPHPYIPFLPIGRELLVMVDRESGIEIIGHDTSPETNFAHAVVRDFESALDFAQRIGFPEHGLIVSGCRDEMPAPDIFLKKDITDTKTLKSVIEEACARFGVAFVESDMRAHRNPTRMAAIERATRDLVRRFRSQCPNCGYRGFDVIERVPGLPCGWCGVPTQVIKAELLICQSCGYQQQRSVATAPTADPSLCNGCNP